MQTTKMQEKIIMLNEECSESDSSTSKSAPEKIKWNDQLKYEM